MQCRRADRSAVRRPETTDPVDAGFAAVEMETSTRLQVLQQPATRRSASHLAAAHLAAVLRYFLLVLAPR